MTYSLLALDPTLIGGVLVELGQEACKFSPVTSIEEQHDRLDWLGWRQAFTPTGRLSALVTSYISALEAFVDEHHFQPPSIKLSQGGIGIITLLDLRLQWGRLSPRGIHDPQTGRFYRGIEILTGFRILVASDDSPVAQVFTESGAVVWLAALPRPNDEFALIKAAVSLMQQPYYVGSEYSGILLPALDITRPVEAQQLPVASRSEPAGHNLQLLRLRTASALAVNQEVQGLLEFDGPFMGIVTPPGLNQPLCVFHAESESWIQTNHEN